jgi:hypothetical protein
MSEGKKLSFNRSNLCHHVMTVRKLLLSTIMYLILLLASVSSGSNLQWTATEFVSPLRFVIMTDRYNVNM